MPKRHRKKPEQPEVHIVYFRYGGHVFAVLFNSGQQLKALNAVARWIEMGLIKKKSVASTLCKAIMEA